MIVNVCGSYEGADCGTEGSAGAAEGSGAFAGGTAESSTETEGTAVETESTVETSVDANTANCWTSDWVFKSWNDDCLSSIGIDIASNSAFVSGKGKVCYRKYNEFKEDDADCVQIRTATKNAKVAAGIGFFNLNCYNEEVDIYDDECLAKKAKVAEDKQKAELAAKLLAEAKAKE